MLTGVLLILAGVGIQLTARSYLAVSSSISETRAEIARRRGLPRWYQRLTAFNVRFGPRSNVWFGRLVGVAAIVVGVVFLLRS